jgi:putative ABC transport system permease protein
MSDIHDWGADVRARVATNGLRPEQEADIVEEVAQHLEAQYEALAPRIGAAAARDQLLAQLRDQHFDAALATRGRRDRSTRRVTWAPGSVTRDIRYGLRSLSRSPGTVVAGIAALALGIGLTTVMFSIIYGLLIKGLPFKEASRIAVIYRTDPTGHGEEDLVPFADFVRYRAAQRSFADFGAYTGEMASVSGGNQPERVQMARVTAGALDVTAVQPVIGRLFMPHDNLPSAQPTAVLGYSLWRDRFAGDSAILGKTIRVNGATYAIIGVMPDGFQFPQLQRLWLPLQLDPAAFPVGHGQPVSIVARLARGVGYPTANADMATLSRRLAREAGDTAAVRDLAQPFVRATIPGRVYSLLYAMLGGVFLVLLVACANVANLLLNRAASRTRETGIRIALGASRVALIRLALVEAGIIAMLAVVVGAGLAQGGILAFNRALIQAQADRPFWIDIRLHVPVLMFAVGAAALASLVSGLLPAIHSARFDVSTILKDESHASASRRAGRLSRGIVVGEIAMSSALLLAAGFMTKSIIRLRDNDPKFVTAGIFAARVSLSSPDTSRSHFFEDLEQRLSGTPGVEAVYIGSGLPGSEWSGQPLTIEGRLYGAVRDHPATRTLAVGPGFFRTFGVRVVRGRPIQSGDRAEAPAVAVVSEAFAQRYFADSEPIGRRLRLGPPDGKDQWVTVVGVVPSLYAATVTSASGNHFPPEVLTAFWQQPRITSARVAIRGAPGVANATTVQKAVTAIDGEVPIYATTSMTEALAQPAWPVRVFGTLFVAFGIASLVLAVIGLYAVMAFGVSRRAREMAIRIALGATSGSMIRMVCRQGAVQIILGMSIGLAAGTLLVQGTRTMLFEVQPNDPQVFALVASVLASAALVACLIPAAAATRVNPIEVLRGD